MFTSENMAVKMEKERSHLTVDLTDIICLHLGEKLHLYLYLIILWLQVKIFYITGHYQFSITYYLI